MCVIYMCAKLGCTWVHAFYHEDPTKCGINPEELVQTRYVNCGCWNNIDQDDTRPIPQGVRIKTEAMAYLIIADRGQRINFISYNNLSTCEHDQTECEFPLLPTDEWCLMCYH